MFCILSVPAFFRYDYSQLLPNRADSLGATNVNSAPTNFLINRIAMERAEHFLNIQPSIRQLTRIVTSMISDNFTLLILLTHTAELGLRSLQSLGADDPSGTDLKPFRVPLELANRLSLGPESADARGSLFQSFARVSNWLASDTQKAIVTDRLQRAKCLA